MGRGHQPLTARLKINSWPSLTQVQLLGQEAYMSITKYEGQTLSKLSLVIEDCCFLNCVLKECDLFYSGGDVEWMNTQMMNCQWHFRGPALKTIQLAQLMGMLKTPQIVPPFPASSSKMN
jgi:hypothetical protein